jgi:hypothetical protein
MSIKQWIRNWLLNENVTLSSRTTDVESSQEHGAQIYINEAMNGRVLTIRTFKPINPQYGNNWISELYVLKDGESLTEALTMLLTLKGIDK